LIGDPDHLGASLGRLLDLHPTRLGVFTKPLKHSRDFETKDLLYPQLRRIARRRRGYSTRRQDPTSQQRLWTCFGT